MAYRGRLPSRQLNSRRAENSLRAYLLPMVRTFYCQNICCQLNRLKAKCFHPIQIYPESCSTVAKRWQKLDRILFDTGLVQVLVSGKRQKDKKTKADNNTDGNEEGSEETCEAERIYPSVSFFIATESENLEHEKEEIFCLLHEAKTDVEI